MNVLIIDECEMVCEALSKYLELQQHSCTLSNNPKNALSLLYNFSYDIIISEYKFSNFDSFLLFKQVQQNFPQIKLIVLTEAELNSRDLCELHNFGIKTVYEKPISANIILETIENSIKIKFGVPIKL